MTFIAGKLFAEDGQLQATTDAVASSAQFIGGWAINQAGEAHVENLGADPVPSSAVFPDGMGIAFTQAGAMYVTTEDPSNAALIGGFAVRQDGALHVSGDDVEASDQLIGGWAFTQEGVARMGGVGLTATASITAINGTAFTGTVNTSEALNSLTDKIGFNFYYGTIEDIPTSEELLANGLSFDTAAQDGTSHTITTNFTGAAPSIQDSFPAFDTDPGPANNNVLVVQFYVAKNAGTGSEVITFTSAIVPVTSATHGVPSGFSVPPSVGETGTLSNQITLAPPDSAATFRWQRDGGIGTWVNIGSATATTYEAVVADEDSDLRTITAIDGTDRFTSTETTAVVAGTAALAYDAASSSTETTTGTNSWTHTPVGTPSKVFVSFCWNNVTRTVSSVTYGGAAMSFVGTVTNATSGYVSEIYGILTPASGAQTVVVTLSGTARMRSGAVSFTGGDDVVLVRGSVTAATGASTTPSATQSSNAADIVLGVMVNDDAAATFTEVDEDIRYNITTTVFREVGMTQAGAASVQISGTLSAFRQWQVLTCSVQGA